MAEISDTLSDIHSGVSRDIDIDIDIGLAITNQKK